MKANTKVLELFNNEVKEEIELTVEPYQESLLDQHFGFEVLNLNKITAGCYGDNIGSVKAFSRVGFREEGRLKNKFFSPSGYQDHILMGLLSSDFKH